MAYDRMFLNWLTRWAISKRVSEEQAKEFAFEVTSGSSLTENKLKTLCKKYGLPFSSLRPYFQKDIRFRVYRA